MSKTTKWLLVASSLWYFGEGLFGPLFAVFSEKVGGDLLDITWAWALYLIITGIAYVAVGRIFNRSKWKYHMIVVGYGLNTIFTFAYLLVDDTTSLLLVQAGLGLAEAICTPSWDALFASDMEEKDNTFLWGIANGHTHFVSGVAIALGGLIAYHFSFETLFVIMGCIQFIATIIQFRIISGPSHT